jgi:hypothetical protein
MRARRLQRYQRKHGAQPNLERLEDRTAPALLGQQLFPADNPWNQRITDAPVAANSDAIMARITNNGASNNRIHPDFSQNFEDHRDLYGIPFNVVHGNSTTKVTVVIDAYPEESDPGGVPIPANAVIEGDWQDGPRAGLNNRGDSHLLIWDVDNNIAYELFRASRPSENGDNNWHADQQTIWDMKTNAFRTLGWTSADAAGTSLLAGLVRPDEALPVDQGGQGVITHAIRFTLQNSIILDQFLYPASHTANPGNDSIADQPPMGARFRLKAGVDISHLNPQARIVAQAMKDYGMILADNGSNFFFQGASYSVDANNQIVSTWDDDDVQDTTHGLKSLRYADFEVVDLTPRVTDLSVHSGTGGTQVTVIGQNFSGGGGQLDVWFGDTEATGVTYIDDGHVEVIAPAGMNTVNVRVQIGTLTDHEDNYTGAIFGYGISAVTTNAQFSYVSGSGNIAPSVALPASASPAPISGTTATLSVLGADDGGEAGLIYDWSVLSKPTAALDPTFSFDGTNAAKTAVATFAQAGSYSFRVTLRDAEGLAAVSEVTVHVAQTVSSIWVTGPKRVRVGNRARFQAYAFDQFGDLLTAAPIFTWSETGPGKISKNGRYSAAQQPGGPYTIAARFGAVKGTTSVRVVRR